MATNPKAAKAHTLFGDTSPTPVVPWWQDDRKVIKRATAAARANSDAWRALRTGIVALAREDEAVRRELLNELKAIGVGKRGRPKAPLYREFLLEAVVGTCNARGETVEAALVLAAQNHPDLFPADLQALKNLWSRIKAKRRAVTRNSD